MEHYIGNKPFQAVPHALHQLMFLYHDRMGAAILLSGGTIVIVILFVFVVVRFAYHPAAAATADQYAGKQIDFIFLGRCTGVQVANPLHQVKIIRRRVCLP